MAAIYFLVDGIEDILSELRTGVSAQVLLECLVALALVLGVTLGGAYARHLLLEARHHKNLLDAARGEMSALIAARFGEWELSKSESEVALFALKGSSITEIAAMRNSAEGTVRSQLSQVFAKAGVKNQSALIAIFVDDLIDPLLE
ncbi:MAG: LuxR C-terminal-related transcriptional regulator [Erythrobacter sp.]